ncbi:hypothetical protein CRG98_020174 [Punica granatum]|uniref:Uncharacterized protein n=1 Tax=Punica granatum TaxID=22663 RepID=A0A2I0JSZ3_PUNGR|nr:hypothetical protein CRG98_020174 [Punica granatum]
MVSMRSDLALLSQIWLRNSQRFPTLWVALALNHTLGSELSLALKHTLALEPWFSESKACESHGWVCHPNMNPAIWLGALGVLEGP